MTRKPEHAFAELVTHQAWLVYVSMKTNASWHQPFVVPTTASTTTAVMTAWTTLHSLIIFAASNQDTVVLLTKTQIAWVPDLLLHQFCCAHARPHSTHLIPTESVSTSLNVPVQLHVWVVHPDTALNKLVRLQSATLVLIPFSNARQLTHVVHMVTAPCPLISNLLPAPAIQALNTDHWTAW
jgi:hypothetical protein